MNVLSQAVSRIEDWRRVNATNFTDASYPSRVDTLTAPTGNAGIIRTALSTAGPAAPWVDFCFFGVGNADTTGKCKILAWTKITEPDNATAATAAIVQWAPLPLVELTLTLSTETGVAGGLVPATSKWIDTLVATAGIGVALVDYVISSNADNTKTKIKVATHGHEYLEAIFNLNSSSTSLNAIYKRLNT